MELKTGIKHAAELWKNSDDGKVRKVKLALWEDGSITSCEGTYDKEGKEIKGTCYTTEPGQEEAFWAFQAHLSSPRIGYKVKSIEVEKGIPPVHHSPMPQTKKYWVIVDKPGDSYFVEGSAIPYEEFEGERKRILDRGGKLPTIRIRFEEPLGKGGVYRR